MKKKLSDTEKLLQILQFYGLKIVDFGEKIGVNSQSVYNLSCENLKNFNRDMLDGMALPSVSNQWSNRAIKEIGDLCGIDEPVLITTHSGRNRSEATMPKWTLLSTHCARRTFVVTALQLGIPIEVITRWTGHSDLKAMRPYIAIVDELKAKNMAKFDEV